MNAGESAVETPKRIRAFVALKTPSAWNAALARLQAELKAKLRSKAFRWSRPEQTHITLRFLGSIRPDEASCSI